MGKSLVYRKNVMSVTRSLALVGVLFLSCLGGGAVAEELNLQLPPSSLAQWYKPAIKRQVWLHNMFKLRREMQAVQEYAALEQSVLTKKWADRFVEHYRKIGEMVPEWQDDLELEWAEKLETAASSGDFAMMDKSLRKLGMSCKSCHRDYRAITAMMYRAPDFSKAQVVSKNDGSSRDYPESMKELSKLVNRIKIASEDERYDVAQKSLSELRMRLNELGESCAACHKDAAPKERILAGPTEEGMTKLEQGLASKEIKTVGRYLGSVAVTACARCHSVHRLGYDVRGLLTD